MTIKEAVELYESLNDLIESNKKLHDKILEKAQEQSPFDTLKLELDITEYRMVMVGITRTIDAYRKRLEEKFTLT